MRLIAVVLMLAASGSAPAHAQSSGAYAAVSAGAADDCSALCRDDSLCMGWTYKGATCGLWASMPAPMPATFTPSARAPGFTREDQSAGAPQVEARASTQSRREPAELVEAALLGGENSQQDLRPRFGGD